MKKIYMLLMNIIIGVSLVWPVMASDLTIPNTFVADTPAVADDVNANFSAVEAAVDDNNSRISNVESTAGDNNTRIFNVEIEVGDNNTRIVNMETILQNITTGCATNRSIRRINPDGSLTCDIDNDTTYTAGVGLNLDVDNSFRVAPDIVSVAGNSLTFDYGNNNVSDLYLNERAAELKSGIIMRAYATFNMPNSVTITGLTCDVYDPANSGLGLVTADLLAIDHTSGHQSIILFRAPESTDIGDQSLETVDLFDPVNGADAVTVNNTRFTYTLRVYMRGSTNITIRLYRCYVSYI